MLTAQTGELRPKRTMNENNENLFLIYVFSPKNLKYELPLYQRPPSRRMRLWSPFKAGKRPRVFRTLKSVYNRRVEKKYLRMIRRMDESPSTVQESSWSVYILRCGDGTYYTGIAKDVEARLQKHNGGTGAAYTRSRRPVRLLYSENGLTRSQALVREAQIKAWPRERKGILADSK